MYKSNHSNVVGVGVPVLDTPPLSALSSLVGPVLYAVRTGGLIKFGFTTDAYERIRKYGDIRNSVLALKPGTRADETALHRSLRAHCAKGREYYHPTPEVIALVNEWRTALNFEPITA